MNPSAVYLQCEIQNTNNPNRLDLKQAWHGMNRRGMNRLDSPTAGNNINTRQSNKAMTRLLTENSEGHMTRTNQWRQDTWNKGTNQNVTHRTKEPLAMKHEGKGSMTQTGTD